jgi:hypothetical protein
MGDGSLEGKELEKEKKRGHNRAGLGGAYEQHVIFSATRGRPIPRHVVPTTTVSQASRRHITSPFKSLRSLKHLDI